MTIKRSSLPIVARNLLATLLLAFAAGCATQGQPGAQPDREALEAATRGEHQVAAARYITLAREATGTERDRYTLLAVEQWLEAGDGRDDAEQQRQKKTLIGVHLIP